MKLSKTNKILSYTSFLLMVYNLFCLSILNTDWYVNNWAILDYYDTPFYLFGLVHVLIYWKNYSFYAKLFVGLITLYLAFKILDYYFLFNYQTFMFWNILILVILPISIIIDKNLNR